MEVMVKARKLVPTLSAVAGVMIVAFGATAWACTAFTTLSGPKSGVAESQVTVEGESLIREADADKEVELRWNGVEGPLLAEITTNGRGAMEAAVTIPDTAPGIYFIVAVAEDRGVARMSFEVMPSPGNPAPVVDPLTEVATADGLGSPAADQPDFSVLLGVALLSVGLVLLAGGTAVLVSNRRKALASEPAPDTDLAS